MGKYLVEGGVFCGKCQQPLWPSRLTENRGHLYVLGQRWTCPCFSSQVWTNSLRNVDSFLRDPSQYREGFCNDLFCGICLTHLLPMENGYQVPWHQRNMDRYGCSKKEHNQGVLISQMTNDNSHIQKWYEEHAMELKSEAQAGQMHRWILANCKFAGAADGFVPLMEGEDADLRALRVSTMAEYEAINLYERLAETVKSKQIRETLLDISREEKVHVGELEHLLGLYDKEHTKALEEGKEEVEKA